MRFKSNSPQNAFPTRKPNNNPTRLRRLKIYYNYTIITIIEAKKYKLRDKFMRIYDSRACKLGYLRH
jgi:hypothetical protein